MIYDVLDVDIFYYVQSQHWSQDQALPFRAERPKMVIHNLKILQKMLEAF